MRRDFMLMTAVLSGFAILTINEFSSCMFDLLIYEQASECMLKGNSNF
jgi:hypothetical protein